ncbi:lytic polysaccharide monooxygenase [Dactylosporangium vinaceum]|uniref:Lytic polysaccharide monooxygenase n=1 Tax=Dactylosporangium vinaceum TaxID=53362 RepID=A0ABV5MDA8_9ACTN|nr:lytic polysaccharide monooxygenase [Dactylosporangium vinaceum]UAC00877.1 lytic polysaccharide monooxygenase [Dactylosporangium vinaceum]
MIARRTSAGIAALLVGGVAALAGPAGAAQAHGAPSTPVSRAYACGAGTAQQKGSAACQAARAAGADVADWDNIRVAGVNGRDRQVIPDGKLCSGGIDAYRGLDLARADWPSTRLTAGAAFTFRYTETIPHKGTFRIYLTNDGYSPGRPLRWADLETVPLLSATDPAVVDGAYTIKGALPKGRTGPHVMYTIWQNSSTADTYYSCSDVVFAAATTTTAPAAPAGSPVPPAGTTGRPSAVANAALGAAPGDGGGAAPSAGAPRLAAASEIASTPVLAGMGGAAVLALGGLSLLLVRRRRRLH